MCNIHSTVSRSDCDSLHFLQMSLTDSLRRKIYGKFSTSVCTDVCTARVPCGNRRVCTDVCTVHGPRATVAFTCGHMSPRAPRSRCAAPGVGVRPCVPGAVGRGGGKRTEHIDLQVQLSLASITPNNNLIKHTQDVSPDRRPEIPPRRPTSVDTPARAAPCAVSSCGVQDLAPRTQHAHE